MAQCLNCLRSCPGLCCSMDCYDERMALMLEGVELLDALVAMVDRAASERGAHAAAVAAAAARPAVKPAKPAARSGDGPQATMPGLLLDVPASLLTPESLDPPGRLA